jgi:hypothetical protein
MLLSLEEILFTQLSEAYIPEIEANIRERKPTHFKLYDVIQGFTGIGLYLIQNNYTEKSQQLLHKLLQLAIKLTAPIEYCHHLVPGWICPAEFLRDPQDRLLNPSGILNMGLSHGVPGLLGFMTIALKAGIEIPGQREAMQTIIEWIKSKATSHENGLFFQARTTFEQQSQNIAPPLKHLSNREAWCYGTPGVARTLYLAGNALGDLDTVHFAAKAFRSIFERPHPQWKLPGPTFCHSQWKLPGPTFCHGIAGLFLITHLMAKDLQSSFLFEKVKELEKTLFNFHNENHPFGFRDWDLCKDGSYHPIDKVSLLTGATGVWLSWLSTQCETLPKWHYPFMIDYA